MSRWCPAQPRRASVIMLELLAFVQVASASTDPTPHLISTAAGPPCPSTLADDGSETMCSAWCSADATASHCSWCMCRACDFCNAEGRRPTPAQPDQSTARALSASVSATSLLARASGMAVNTAHLLTDRFEQLGGFGRSCAQNSAFQTVRQALAQTCSDCEQLCLSVDDVICFGYQCSLATAMIGGTPSMQAAAAAQPGTQCLMWTGLAPELAAEMALDPSTQCWKRLEAEERVTADKTEQDQQQALKADDSDAAASAALNAAAIAARAFEGVGNGRCVAGSPGGGEAFTKAPDCMACLTECFARRRSHCAGFDCRERSEGSATCNLFAAMPISTTAPPAQHGEGKSLDLQAYEATACYRRRRSPPPPPPPPPPVSFGCPPELRCVRFLRTSTQSPSNRQQGASTAAPSASNLPPCEGDDDSFLQVDYEYAGVDHSGRPILRSRGSAGSTPAARRQVKERDVRWLYFTGPRNVKAPDWVTGWALGASYTTGTLGASPPPHLRLPAAAAAPTAKAGLGDGAAHALLPLGTNTWERSCVADGRASSLNEVLNLQCAVCVPLGVDENGILSGTEGTRNLRTSRVGCTSLELAWDAPQPPEWPVDAPLPRQYLIARRVSIPNRETRFSAVADALVSEYNVVEVASTAAPAAQLRGLLPGLTYEFQVSPRMVDGPWGAVTAPIATTMATSTDYAGWPLTLELLVDPASPEFSCSVARLRLASAPGCETSARLFIECSVADDATLGTVGQPDAASDAGDNWRSCPHQSFDEASGTAEVRGLSALTAYRFRAVMQQDADDVGAKPLTLRGESTPPLMVGWPSPSLLGPPTVHPLSSASFAVSPPEDTLGASCRASAEHPIQWAVEVLDTRSLCGDDGGTAFESPLRADHEGAISSVRAAALKSREADWRLLRSSRDQTAQEGASGAPLEISSLRCPPPCGCAFRTRPTNVMGGAALASDPLVAFSTLLPQLPPGADRLEVRLHAAASETAAALLRAAAAPPPGTSQLQGALLSPELADLKNRFARELQAALGAKQGGVNVLEVRGGGRYVVFDLMDGSLTPVLRGALFLLGASNGVRSAFSAEATPHQKRAQTALRSGSVTGRLDTSGGLLQQRSATAAEWEQLAPGLVEMGGLSVSSDYRGGSDGGRRALLVLLLLLALPLAAALLSAALRVRAAHAVATPTSESETGGDAEAVLRL